VSDSSLSEMQSKRGPASSRSLSKQSSNQSSVVINFGSASLHFKTIWQPSTKLLVITIILENSSGRYLSDDHPQLSAQYVTIQCDFNLTYFGFLVATSVLNHPEQVINNSKIEVHSYDSWLTNKKVNSVIK
jgi:hypothetical protein